MSLRPYTLYVRNSLVLVSAVALCSCSQWFAPPPQEPVEQQVQQKSYDAPAYIFSLSQALLVLENGGTAKEVASDLKVIESYSAVKRSKPTVLKLVVMDYTLQNGGSTEKVMVYTGSQGQDTASLSKLTKRMNSYKATLSEIKVLSVAVKPGPKAKLTRHDAKQLQTILSAEQDEMLAGATKLASLDEARMQIELLEFFMQRKEKDAAYLCADTAKRLLAKAARREENEAQANALSAKLDKLEGTLRQNMPY
jgi:hypothetical protein